MAVIRQDHHGAVEQLFDLRQRDAVLYAFRPIAVIPLKPGKFYARVYVCAFVCTNVNTNWLSVVESKLVKAVPSSQWYGKNGRCGALI